MSATAGLSIGSLRVAVIGIRLAVLGTRGKVEGRYVTVGEPQAWEIVGLTRRSVILAPVAFHGEAMLDKRRSFRLPEGVSEHASGLVNVIHPMQVDKLQALIGGCARMADYHIRNTKAEPEAPTLDEVASMAKDAGYTGFMVAPASLDRYERATAAADKFSATHTREEVVAYLKKAAPYAFAAEPEAKPVCSDCAESCAPCPCVCHKAELEAKPIHPPCCIKTHYCWLASGVRGYDAQKPCACSCHAPTETP